MRFDYIMVELVNDRLCLEIHAFPNGGNRLLVAYIDHTEREWRDQEVRKLSQAVEQSPAAVAIIDVNRMIEYVNPHFVTMTGYRPDEVIGFDWNRIEHDTATSETLRGVDLALTKGQPWRGEVKNIKKSGEHYWESISISPIRAPDRTTTHALIVKEDITQRKEYERRLLFQANYDELTTLPNRLLTLDRLTQAINHARRERCAVALLFIDLDDFKKVNDTLGHAVGDQLLIEAAQRLRRLVRASDTVGRLGGDEFLIVLPDQQDITNAQIVAHKVITAFSEPFFFNNQSLVLSTSIGIASFPSDGTDPNVLMRNADMAMYRAKEGGRNSFQFFAKEMDEQAARRLQIECNLRTAIANLELFLEFQPIIESANERIIGAEALLRWRNNKLGLVAPNDFIFIAEQSGLIIEMGEFVLDQACRQIRAIEVALGLPLRVSVNVSSRQFRGPALVQAVEQALATTGMAPSSLELEITERVIVDDSPTTVATLERLASRGIRLAIDDFGTGYSSLSYLRQFPVNVLKIDRSLLSNIDRDRKSAALVRAIVSMAHALELEVVAEGVETEGQVAAVRQAGCDLAQGFVFARPLSAAGFIDMARRWTDDRRCGADRTGARA